MLIYSLSHKMCLQLGQITGLLSARFLICTCPNSPFFPSHLENVSMYLLKLNEDCWLSDTTFVSYDELAGPGSDKSYNGREKGTFSLISFRRYFWTASITVW